MKHITNLSEGSINCYFFKPEQTLPLVIEDQSGKVDLLMWAKEHRSDILACQLKYGGVLFRGFNISGHEAFEDFITITSTAPITYSERSSPRDAVGGQIYTSTSHRSDQEIFLHNEQSYNLKFPRCIYFFSNTVAAEGGETPVADTRKILARLSDDLLCKLMEKGYIYQRNFNRSFGLSWQEAFQTEDKKDVSQYCDENNIEHFWHNRDNDIELTTKQRREAVAVHPITQEKCWFNHCTFFNFYTLDESIQQVMKMNFDLSSMPNHTYLGDGTELTPAEVEELKNAYLAEKVMYPWKKNDVLMLDNILSSHGRQPFHGERMVWVGMSDIVDWETSKINHNEILEL